MKKILGSLIVVCVFISASAMAADTSCDIGLYSRYINGVGGVAGEKTGVKKESAVQGSCRRTSENGYYIDGWASQSTWKPGFGDRTFANELDLMVGLSKKINKEWSYDAHLSYYDIANPKLLNGINGDLANGGGTLNYQVTLDTKVYGNLEGYHGIGNLGLPGGWRGGLGVRTLFGPVVVDGTLFHNHNFLGHGEFLKVMFEPKAPIAKFAGGEIRPTLFIWQPLGEYGKTHDRQIVGAIHITF